MLKRNDLYQLIQQHCPAVQYLDPDTPEIAEGECLLWGRDDCTFLLDYDENALNCHDLVGILQQIAAKMAFLEQAKNDILAKLSTEKRISGSLNATPEQLAPTIYCVYCAFFVESADEIFCDFALASDTDGLSGKMAEYTLEINHQFTFNGLSSQ